MHVTVWNKLITKLQFLGTRVCADRKGDADVKWQWWEETLQGWIWIDKKSWLLEHVYSLALLTEFSCNDTQWQWAYIAPRFYFVNSISRLKGARGPWTKSLFQDRGTKSARWVWGILCGAGTQVRNWKTEEDLT